MTAPCTSTMFSKYENNSKIWNDQSKMFGSPFDMILHDPECQNNCCSSFRQPTQATNFNVLGQYPKFPSCYSDNNILNSTTWENQFIYDVDTSKDQEGQKLELQEALGQCIGNNLGLAHSEINYEKPMKMPRYESCILISSTKSQCKQKGYCKDSIKRKRKRTIFNTEQIVVMERVFKIRPYVSREERLFLSQRLNISEKTIKIWFQNRRRVTDKKVSDQSDAYHSDSTVEEVFNDYNTRLDYIESQIYQNIDEHGYVTLDSKALSELVKLIDSVLSNSNNRSNSDDECNRNESYLMYEPVSPESLSDDNRDSENILKWEPSRPEESLQRLIDIQSILYS